MGLNVKNLATISEVAKKSDEKSQILSLKIINDEDLMDYPRNNEDISYTEDLETAITQNGFSDPLEVTDFEMETGKYMIVSGHRRRAAARKCGMTKYPCIIRHFENENAVYNYVLMSNTHRNGENDPLLYCKRYKMHEEYLRDTGFKGNINSEIAKRLGMSPQHTERFGRFNRVIMPCWDLVRDEKVGMSSLLPLATMSAEDQKEVYQAILYCLENEIEPTRTKCKSIVEKYKAGVRDIQKLVYDESKSVQPVWDVAAMRQADEAVKQSDAANETVEAVEEPLRNGEVNYSNPSCETYLEEDKNNFNDEKMSEEDYAAIEKSAENAKREAKQEDAETVELKYKKGESLHKTLSQSLVTLGKGYYAFRDDKELEGFVELLSNMIEVSATELYDLSSDNEMGERCKKLLKRNKDNIEKICKTFNI